MKQADKSDTETPGISRKCTYKKLSRKTICHNTAMKMYWIEQTLKWLGNTLATRAVTFHIVIIRAYTKNTENFHPSNYCTSKREGTHGNKDGNLGRHIACCMHLLIELQNTTQIDYLVTPTVTLNMTGVPYLVSRGIPHFKSERGLVTNHSCGSLERGYLS